MAYPEVKNESQEILAEHSLPLGFHFAVDVQDDTSTNYASQPDAKFQTVTGLSVDMELEEIAEGGENRYKHKLPVKSKYPNLVLKRGFQIESDFVDWVKDAILNFDFKPKNLNVVLLNEEHKTVYVWNVIGAIPVKWNVEGLNAEESKIMVESIELAYNYFEPGTKQDT